MKSSRVGLAVAGMTASVAAGAASIAGSIGHVVDTVAPDRAPRRDRTRKTGRGALELGDSIMRIGIPAKGGSNAQTKRAAAKRKGVLRNRRNHRG